MSLVSTLAKVALKVAVAKGLRHVSRNGVPGLSGGGSRSVGTQPRSAAAGSSAGAGHGLEGMMGQILGVARTHGVARRLVSRRRALARSVRKPSFRQSRHDSRAGRVATENQASSPAHGSHKRGARCSSGERSGLFPVVPA